jgi:hypothetical protein
MNDQQVEWVELFEQHGQRYTSAFYAPVNVSQAEAEQELGIQLPRSYLAFVEALQASDLPLEDVVEGYHDDAYPSWPEYLVPFFHDGMGNCYAFDTRCRSPEGEYPIVYWDHERTRDENIVRMGETDASFPEWVERCARDEISGRAWQASGSRTAIGCIAAVCLAVFLMVVGAVAVWNWMWGGE